jgi:hypothetical protein
MKNWCFFGKLKSGSKPRQMWHGKKFYETILSFVYIHPFEAHPAIVIAKKILAVIDDCVKVFILYFM